MWPLVLGSVTSSWFHTSPMITLLPWPRFLALLRWLVPRAVNMMSQSSSKARPSTGDEPHFAHILTWGMETTRIVKPRETQWTMFILTKATERMGANPPPKLVCLEEVLISSSSRTYQRAFTFGWPEITSIIPSLLSSRLDRMKVPDYHPGWEASAIEKILVKIMLVPCRLIGNLPSKPERE